LEVVFVFYICSSTCGLEAAENSKKSKIFQQCFSRIFQQWHKPLKTNNLQ